MLLDGGQGVSTALYSVAAPEPPTQLPPFPVSSQGNVRTARALPIATQTKLASIPAPPASTPALSVSDDIGGFQISSGKTAPAEGHWYLECRHGHN